jgi:hypothetical protein
MRVEGAGRGPSPSTDHMKEQRVTTTPTNSAQPRRRRIGGRALLVIGAVLLPITMTSVWVRNIVLDTDRYVETVSPLGSDPAIRAAAVERVTTALMDAVDVEASLANLLPDSIDGLAGTLEAAVRTLVARTTERILESERFQTVWDNANRVAHEQVRQLLTETDVRELPGGRVVIDLAGVVAEVQVALIDRGLTFFEQVPITAIAAQLEVFDAATLRDVQGGVRVVQALVWLLVALTIASFVAAVVLAADRRRAIAHVGVAIAISMGVFAALVSLGRSLTLDALEGSVESLAASEATFDTLVRYLRDAVRAFFVLGLVMLVVAWLAGPSRAGRAVRSRLARRSADAAYEPSDVSVWIGANANALRLGVVGVVGAAAVAVDHPSPRTVVIGAAVIVAGLVAIALAAPAKIDSAG